MVKNSIKVFARIKRVDDQSLREKYDIRTKNDSQEITFVPDGNVEYGFYKNNLLLKYRFQTVFDQTATQNDVFDIVAKPVIDSVLEGYNGTIFAYGQTGSGKTFSITGAPHEYNKRGIIPRTIEHVFKHVISNTSVIYNVYISYLEIYNEDGFDLLKPRNKATYLEDLPRVMLLEDAQGETHLRNLNVIPVASEQEAMRLLYLGDMNRTVAETPMNMYSSRSHCIFTVYIAANMTDGGKIRRSKLHLVDLAGSERILKSNISGRQSTEARQINLSLHYLEQVIMALSESNRTHIPYRNSMMTTVLKDSLGGNCLTAMLATISVEPKNLEETISTCKFAQRVAMVDTEAIINEEEDPKQEIANLKLEIERLKRELALCKEPTEASTTNGRDLTVEQIDDCKMLVKNYLEGSPLNERVVVNDTRKVHLCFELFKQIINSTPRLSSTDLLNVNKYKDIIEEKDNEIYLLNKKISKSMLVQDIPDIIGHKQPLEISVKNAYIQFMNDPNNRSEADSCVIALKQKLKIARSIADRIEMGKQNIINIQEKIAKNSNCGINLKDTHRELIFHQDIYANSLKQLQSLKDEIDHLKHSLDQAKLRMEQRFKESWRREQEQRNVFSNPLETYESSSFDTIEKISLGSTFNEQFDIRSNSSYDSICPSNNLCESPDNMTNSISNQPNSTRHSKSTTENYNQYYDSPNCYPGIPLNYQTTKSDVFGQLPFPQNYNSLRINNYPNYHPSQNYMANTDANSMDIPNSSHFSNVVPKSAPQSHLEFERFGQQSQDLRNFDPRLPNFNSPQQFTNYIPQSALVDENQCRLGQYNVGCNEKILFIDNEQIRPGTSTDSGFSPQNSPLPNQYSMYGYPERLDQNRRNSETTLINNTPNIFAPSTSQSLSATDIHTPIHKQFATTSPIQNRRNSETTLINNTPNIFAPSTSQSLSATDTHTPFHKQFATTSPIQSKIPNQEIMESEQNNNDTSDDLPLTGDPEVDEEIKKFYRSRENARNIINN